MGERRARGLQGGQELDGRVLEVEVRAERGHVGRARRVPRNGAPEDVGGRQRAPRGQAGREHRERQHAYPGSFDPPTVAHLAVAESAFEQLGVDRVDLG